jgi:hypothetical protein
LNSTSAKAVAAIPATFYYGPLLARAPSRSCAAIAVLFPRAAGATFTGRARSEPTLLHLACAFEQATQIRSSRRCTIDSR